MPTSSGKKIVIYGAGAVGSLIGGLLARGGEDVTLIGRRDHVGAINNSGLMIRGSGNDERIMINASENLDFSPDIVLLAMKTQDEEDACRTISKRAQRSLIVTLQNGVRSDDIAANYFPLENIVSGVVMFNAQYLKPGEVNYAQKGTVIIGDPFTKNAERLYSLQSLLNLAVKTRISDNIRGVHQTKLLINNMGNGMEAMTGLSMVKCMQNKVIRDISIQTLREGYRVLKKAGYHPEPLPGVAVPFLKFMVHAPLFLTGWLLKRTMGNMDTLGSTLQSIRRGRPTEIDYLNGEIVKIGQKTGMATPFNSGVVKAVKEVEKNGRFLSPAELAKWFRV